MSINSELKYLYFLKKSGIDSFLQNTPIYRFNTTSPKKFKESSAKKKLDEIDNIDELKLYFNNYDKCLL